MTKNLQKLMLLIIACSFISYAQVQLKFITQNGYGNNLYIDNVTVGNRFNVDAAVGSINNINNGTSYAVSTESFTVAPNVSVFNMGKQDITTEFTVTMTASPIGYTSTKTISSLSSGQYTDVVFDDLTITPSQELNINITTNLSGDENAENNTFEQNTIYLPGAQRNILFEEWTSSTCGPCASNNPSVDAFIAANFSTVVPVKYHMNWPAPGNDPMYLYNPTQATDRRSYYGVNAVPNVIVDGCVDPAYPYTLSSSLPDAYNSRINVGSPLTVTVTDTKVGDYDSIKADITVEVLSPLETGQYYLRVHAVERHIHYTTAPGSNGEKDFYDVFRKAYPNSLGTSIPTAVGTYNYSITYALDNTNWVDSMMYTIAFVQNDETKEIINCGKGRDEVSKTSLIPGSNQLVEKPVVAPELISAEQSVIFNHRPDDINSVFNYELFEGEFPASGWTLKNPDGGLTYIQYTGANGPSFGGTKSVKMDFYSYSTTGATDTLISKVFTGADVMDSVKFNYAYAQYNSSYIDGLVVLLSVDGGLTFPHKIFDKSGSALSTTSATTNAFVPTAGQWATFSYSLESLLPVELTSFTAQVTSSNVNLSWTTATEINNLGFEIERSVDNKNFITVGFVKGSGTVTEPKSYLFKDNYSVKGTQTVYYRLKQVDYNGTYDYSDAISVVLDIPAEYSLGQNYPNPFNPSTKIKYSVPQNGLVSIVVYDVTGQVVSTLVNEVKEAGNYEVDFNAAGLSSGIYFYIMTSNEFTQIKKMSILK